MRHQAQLERVAAIHHPSPINCYPDLHHDLRHQAWRLRACSSNSGQTKMPPGEMSSRSAELEALRALVKELPCESGLRRKSWLDAEGTRTKFSNLKRLQGPMIEQLQSASGCICTARVSIALLGMFLLGALCSSSLFNAGRCIRCPGACCL